MAEKSISLSNLISYNDNIKANYQAIIDTDLKTTDKTVTGAINENKDKIDILNATVGTGTLPTTNQNLKGAITELFQNVVNAKGLLADTLTTKGIPSSASETWDSLIAKVEALENTGIVDYLYATFKDGNTWATKSGDNIIFK